MVEIKGEKIMKREYCSMCHAMVFPVEVTHRESYQLAGIRFTYPKRSLCCPRCEGEFYNSDISLLNTENRRLNYLQAKGE